MKLTTNADQVAKRVGQWAANVGPELARGTLQAATVVTATAKQEAPVRSGRLRRSIAYQAGGEARYVVSPNVPYAAAVHEGIANPVLIRPVRAKALFWKGARHPVKSVMQKTRAGNPFMTRARVRSEPRIRDIARRVGSDIVTRQG